MRERVRPPDTPGWQIPVRYTLIWMAAFIVTAAAFAVITAMVFGTRWVGLAVVPATLLVTGARYVYEHRR